MNDIRINHPDDGNWVMLRVGGVYNEKTDHCIAVYDGERTLGGVVFTGWLGASIVVHMAGSEKHWASGDFLWMCFHYAFVQLGVRKLFGLVDATNIRAIKIDLQLGFWIIGKLPEATVAGDDMLIVSMSKDRAKWLRYKPRHHKSNQEVTYGG